MTNYSAAETEEAKYEIWVMGGGRERGEEKHRELADAALADLEINKGYRIIETSMSKDGSWDEFPLRRAVIYKHEEVTVIKWHAGNKGWFSPHKTGGGAGRWTPEAE